MEETKIVHVAMIGHSIGIFDGQQDLLFSVSAENKNCREKVIQHLNENNYAIDQSSMYNFPWLV